MQFIIISTAVVLFVAVVEDERRHRIPRSVTGIPSQELGQEEVVDVVTMGPHDDESLLAQYPPGHKKEESEEYGVGRVHVAQDECSTLLPLHCALILAEEHGVGHRKDPRRHVFVELHH